jgi:hypothetical protein
LVSYYFTLSEWHASDSIRFDTLTFNGGTLFYIDPTGPASGYHPYWTGPVTVYDSPCCQARVGDANCSGGDEPTVADVSALIDFLFISGGPLCCIAEADVNKSGGANPTEEDITIGDISQLQDYLFISQDPELLQPCY